MRDIQCPNCQKLFTMRDESYLEIIEQIRKNGFDEEIEERVKLIEEKKFLEYALKLKEKEEEIVKIKSDHSAIVQSLKDENDNLKRIKRELNTKSLGEDLEKYCFVEYEKIGHTAFPNGIFEKDNKAVQWEGESKGTKGDFIYREEIEKGVPLISIMFEMKTEGETGKKTNESHLEKLDKDRKKKNCEYAVLVSELEPGNELYDLGIVDKSHLYEKTYVIRPQYLIQMISILRNAALGSVDTKKRIAECEERIHELEERNVDVENFEEKLSAAVNRSKKKYESASERSKAIINDIDAMITSLQNIKEELEKEVKDNEKAHNELDKLTIRKLCKDSPLLKEEFKKNS